MAINNDMTDETRDGLEMFGVPLVQFEAPSKQIIKTKQGFKTVTTDGWIKFGIAFRNELAKMEGESLAVFMCICLHVNNEREAWPSLDTICLETNRARATVVKSIKHLKKLGLLEVTRDPKHRSNTYRPLYAAYGNSSTIELPTVQNLNSNSSTIEPEVEPGSRTKKDSSRKRERTPLEIELSELQTLFSELSHIPEPNPKTDKEKKAIATRWYQPLRRIQAVCNGKSPVCIRAAITEMSAKGLTISAPQSIEQTALSEYGKIERGAINSGMTVAQIQQATRQSEGAQRLAELRKRQGQNHE